MIEIKDIDLRLEDLVQDFVVSSEGVQGRVALTHFNSHILLAQMKDDNFEERLKFLKRNPFYYSVEAIFFVPENDGEFQYEYSGYYLRVLRSEKVALVGSYKQAIREAQEAYTEVLFDYLSEVVEMGYLWNRQVHIRDCVDSRLSPLLSKLVSSRSFTSELNRYGESFELTRVDIFSRGLRDTKVHIDENPMYVTVDGSLYGFVDWSKFGGVSANWHGTNLNMFLYGKLKQNGRLHEFSLDFKPNSLVDDYVYQYFNRFLRLGVYRPYDYIQIELSKSLQDEFARFFRRYERWFNGFTLSVSLDKLCAGSEDAVVILSSF